MGQQTKIPFLVSDATGNDGRMNSEPLRKLHDAQRRWVVLYLARIPYVLWNKPILGPFIRFGFSRITSRGVHVAKTQIIDECFIFRVAHMATDMSKLVQQAEPEVIEPIIAQRQSNNGCTVGELKGRTVEVGTW